LIRTSSRIGLAQSIGNCGRSCDDVSRSHLIHLFASDRHLAIAEATEATKDKPKRERKEAFRIDFLTPSEQNLKKTAEALFAPATRGNINLAGYNVGRKNADKSKKRSRGKKAAESKGQDEHTLPDDMHFSSRQLVTLFLKPKFSVSIPMY
jgi:condensin complex subunit 2